MLWLQAVAGRGWPWLGWLGQRTDGRLCGELLLLGGEAGGTAVVLWAVTGFFRRSRCGGKEERAGLLAWARTYGRHGAESGVSFH